MPPSALAHLEDQGSLARLAIGLECLVQAYATCSDSVWRATGRVHSGGNPGYKQPVA